MKNYTFYKLPAILIIAFLVVTFLPATVQGQKTFTGTGNFSTAARWSGGTLPVAGDNLVIDGACTVDNSGVTDNVAYGTLTIGTATGRTLNWIASGTNRLNVSNVSAGAGASTLSMDNGGTLIIRGTLSPTNLTFLSGTGTMERQLAGASMTSYSTFNNLVINTSGTISPAANITVNGNLTVTSGTFSVGAFSLAVAGITTVTDTLTITSTTGTKTFGDLTINGTFNNTAANEPITVNGDFQNNGVYNGGTARVTFTGAASNTVTGTAVTTAFGGGITVNKGIANTNVLDVQSVITMSAGGLTLTNGTFKLSSASTITPFTANITSSPYLIPSTAGLWCNGGTMNTPAAGMAWTPNGLIRVSAGTLNAGYGSGDFVAPRPSTSIIVDGGNFNMADRLSLAGSTWSFSMTSGTMTIAEVGSNTADRPPFNMDMAGNSFSMSGGTIIIAHKGGSAGQNLGYYNIATGGTGFTGGTLQIGNGSTPAASTIGITSTNPIYNLEINCASSTAQLQTSALTVSNTVTISAGTLSANNLNLTVGGDWINNDSFTAGTGTVIFNGTGAQIISGSQALNLSNLVTDNSSGITLNTNLAVSGAHTFTAGIITTSATPNYLIYNAGSSYSGDADSRHVNGWVKKIGSTNFIFPVGNGTVERTVALNTLSVSSEFNAKYFATTPFTDQIEIPVWDVNNPEYWSINKVSGGTASVTLNWDNSKVNFSNWIVPDILVTGYDGSLWVTNGGTASGNAATTGTITSNSISSFNLFTFGSSSYILPLTLISFTAKRPDNVTQLAWTTANEFNMDRFVAERSDDNVQFYSIGELPARNNFNTENYFSRDDRAINGIAYYRLRCIDNDNKEKFSQVVLVRDISANKVLTLGLNPLNDQIVLLATQVLNGLFEYRITTMSGQLMQQGNLNILNGGQYKILLKGNVIPGTYLLNVKDTRQSFSFKIIKK